MARTSAVNVPFLEWVSR